jgi:hypothetical protein
VFEKEKKRKEKEIKDKKGRIRAEKVSYLERKKVKV